MAEQKEEKKVVSRIKVKKKLWYKIIAPKVFANKEVGESYLTSPESAIGRIVKINLKELTGNVKDQNNYVILQVNKASGSQLNTVLLGYELNIIGIKRAVRKNINRLDDTFYFKTKGGRDVVAKTLMITVNKTQHSKCTLLRKKLKELLQEEISKSGLDTFIANLAAQKIQGGIRKRLSKIYPVRELAIKSLKLKEKGLMEEEVVVEDKPEEVKAEQPTANESIGVEGAGVPESKA